MLRLSWVSSSGARRARPCMDGRSHGSHIGERGHHLNFRRGPRRIAATLPDGREAERHPDGKGAYFVTLPRDVLDKLNYLRGPGESYSDVIIRVARG
jgi:hypothetical protein